MSEEFTHISENNIPHMVEVGDKAVTKREGVASVTITLPASLLKELKASDSNHKGPILHTCVLAGIQAVKKTSELIPLCHPLPVTGVKVSPEIDEELSQLKFIVTVRTDGKTGVEMEALHGASIAALTFYDMVKSSYKDLQITDLMLLEKSGGKSGHYKIQR
jgi:cyclic pyranopterin monophosphate synthase